MTDLPDTPAWSRHRREIINRTWWLGAVMVLGGAAGSYAGLAEAIASSLITWGVSLTGSVMAAYLTAASGERAAAWMAGRGKP